MGMTITTIDELKNYADGEIVELPAFGENQPFVAKLRRPSMLTLVKNGRIPNSLLVNANKLFEQGVSSFNSADENAMNEMFDILDVICEASFVQPTYSQIKEAGLELTDEQYLFVFDYAQNGVRSLESFRKQQGDS